LGKIKILLPQKQSISYDYALATNLRFFCMDVWFFIIDWFTEIFEKKLNKLKWLATLNQSRFVRNSQLLYQCS